MFKLEASNRNSFFLSDDGTMGFESKPNTATPLQGVQDFFILVCFQVNLSQVMYEVYILVFTWPYIAKLENGLGQLFFDSRLHTKNFGSIF